MLSPEEKATLEVALKESKDIRASHARISELLDLTEAYEAQRRLPDAPCSVNLFFKLDGYPREAQATGRGWTPAEAADNLAATIEQVRARLAPPPAPTLAERIGKELSRALEKVGHDREKWLRCSDAALMVIRGAVYAEAGGYVVWDNGEAVPYHLAQCGPCTCNDAQAHAGKTPYYCTHQMALWFALKCDGLADVKAAPDVDVVEWLER